MKYFFMLALFLKATPCDSQQLNFTIKGRINKDSKAEKLYLQGNFINVEIPITAERKFFYKGTSAQPEDCFIKTDNSFAWSIWIANGDIDVTLQEWEFDEPDPSGKKLLRITALSGPAETEKYKWFADEKNTISKRFPNLSLTQHKDSMIKYFDPLLENYISQHPHSKLSVRLGETAFSRENRKKFLSMVDSEISEHERFRVENELKRDSATMVGLTIEDFAMKTIKEKSFYSKSLSSKYTLIDFWAHDCYPCRAQHPALIKVYNEFHRTKFEIVAVFLGESKNEWRKAVKKDKAPWVHISDLKGWSNILAKRFFIEVIPFNILIDNNNKIIARNLGPSELEQKLKELIYK